MPDPRKDLDELREIRDRTAKDAERVDSLLTIQGEIAVNLEERLDRSRQQIEILSEKLGTVGRIASQAAEAFEYLAKELREADEAAKS